jgi:hypothetical protein
MNAGYSFQDFELIESVFVSSNTASISFNNLNQYATDYKHLQVRMIARSATINANVHMRFNGVSTSSYSSHFVLGGGGGSASSANDINASRIIQVCNLPPTHFAVSILDILDAFSITKNKTTRRLGGFSVDGGLMQVSLASGAFYSTTPTSSLTIFGDVDLSVGSRISLYGIR